MAKMLHRVRILRMNGSLGNDVKMHALKTALIRFQCRTADCVWTLTHKHFCNPDLFRLQSEYFQWYSHKSVFIPDLKTTRSCDWTNGVHVLLTDPNQTVLQVQLQHDEHRSVSRRTRPWRIWRTHSQHESLVSVKRYDFHLRKMRDFTQYGPWRMNARPE